MVMKWRALNTLVETDSTARLSHSRSEYERSELGRIEGGFHEPALIRLVRLEYKYIMRRLYNFPIPPKVGICNNVGKIALELCYFELLK